METTTTERAGAKLYKALLSQYQAYRDSAERDMNQSARAFADQQKPEDRTNYAAAKAKHTAWEMAIDMLSRNGGDWLRLDFPKQ